MTKVSRAAIITIDEKCLLEMLDFEGGKIHDIRRPGDEWKPTTIELLIEHPDLDEVEPGSTLHKVYPSYSSSAKGLCRIDPPKLSKRR